MPEEYLEIGFFYNPFICTVFNTTFDAVTFVGTAAL
jgi:hypothetical protein